MMAVMMMVMIGDDDALWLEDEEGSDEVEDESIFALDPDSVAVVQVEGAHFWRTFDITNVTR